MAESASVFNTPVLWINTYLQEKIGLDTQIGVPFFPSRPTTIDELTEQWITITPENQGQFSDLIRLPYAGVMATWDRLIRMRRSPFPHIKQEQLLYYFYATESDVTEKMVQVQEKVLRLMDREDETAEEINKWAKARGQIDGMDCKFFFHKFRVYQLEEVRDIIDFGTSRTYGGNKIIIDFEYHQDNSILNP
jgi:hypothetical protein